jgi:DNA-binding NtrC family response regulator
VTNRTTTPALGRLAEQNPSLAREIQADFDRLVLAGSAMAWARDHLARLAAAGSRSAVLQLLADEARALTGVASAWALAWSGDADRIHFDALALSGAGSADVPPPELISTTVVGQVARDRRPAFSDDALLDHRFTAAQSVQAIQLRSVGCLPVGEHAVLYLHDPDRPGLFTAEHQARLSSLCELATPFVQPPAEVTATDDLGRAAPAIPGMVGASTPMLELRSTIAAFAAMPWPALILGETGTGKELVARALHTLSPRADAPFVPVNCGAIPESLAESLLFGHEKGAFTGADGRKQGLVERASAGTLFLDEVGELPATAQVKLLRLLQEGTFERVGGSSELRFTGRVVAATLRPVQDATDRGDFRADLFHRLGACVLRVPPLHDRRSDIPQLAEHLLDRALEEVGGVAALSLSAPALAALRSRDWPGNVRDLNNAIRAGVAWATAAGSPTIEPQHLVGGQPGASESADALPELPVDLQSVTEQFQQRLVRAALDQADGHKAQAAQLLGVSRQWLHRLVTRWGDDLESP